MSTIETYYDQIHKAAWVRRVAGTLTGGVLGVAYGAAIGLVAAFLPCLLGALAITGAATVALPGLAAIAASMALFAGAGGFLGIALATDVGANAGALAAGLALKEKREANSVAATEPSPTVSAAPRIFSARAASVTAPLFAGFGALIAITPHPAVSSALAMLTGVVTGPAAVIASTVIFGLFGATIGFKNARFSNQLSNFFTRIITDQQAYKLEPAASSVQPELQPTVTIAKSDHHDTDYGFSAQKFLQQYQSQKTERNRAGLGIG